MMNRQVFIKFSALCSQMFFFQLHIDVRHCQQIRISPRLVPACSSLLLSAEVSSPHHPSAVGLNPLLCKKDKSKRVLLFSSRFSRTCALLSFCVSVLMCGIFFFNAQAADAGTCCAGPEKMPLPL